MAAGHIGDRWSDSIHGAGAVSTVWEKRNSISASHVV